jgi:hypothetical protein
VKAEYKVATAYWDNKTKLLHLGLAITVTAQLLSSLFMQPPEDGHPATGLAGNLFEIHEWMGMNALVIVLTNWI